MNLITPKGKINNHARKILENDPLAKESLIHSTSFLPEDVSILERLVVLRDRMGAADVLCPYCKSTNRAFRIGTRMKFLVTCASSECSYLATSEKSKPILAKKKEEIALSISKALRKIGDDGLTPAKRGSIKCQETLTLKGGREYKTEHLHSEKTRNQRRVSLMANEEARSAKSEWWKNVHHSGISKKFTAKTRATNEANGRWAPLDKTNEYAEYRRKVRSITSKQPVHLLINSHRRAHNDYHLDHIVSIKTGWKLGIPPEKIGNIANLRFIPRSDNCRKQDRNSGEQISSLLLFLFF
jgi:hypothetical protein